MKTIIFRALNDNDFGAVIFYLLEKGIIEKNIVRDKMEMTITVIDAPDNLPEEMDAEVKFEDGVAHKGL